jgi:hypothetical protein
LAEENAMTDPASIESRNKELIRTAFDKWIAGTGGVFYL